MIAWIGYLVLRDEMPAKDAPLVCFPCCKLIGLCLGSLPLAIFSIGPVCGYSKWPMISLTIFQNGKCQNLPRKKNRGRMGMGWTKSAKKDGQNKVKSSDMDSLTFGFLLNAI